MHAFPHKKILVVLAARLGDTIFCTPAIHFLKQKFPSLQIDALVLSKIAAEVLANNPAVENVFLATEKEECKKIAEQYSLVICLHNDATNRRYILELTNECWLAPEFVADLTKHPSQLKLNFLQKKLAIEPLPESERFFLYPQSKDQEKIANLLKEQGIEFGRHRLIGCHLGCHGLARRSLRLKFWRRWDHDKVWSHNNYLKLIRRLHASDPNIRVVLTGTKNEIILGNKLLRKEKRCISLIDKTSVQEMAALMPHLKVFITGDTGPLHIACTNSVSLVVLYGSYMIKVPPYPVKPNHTLIYQPSIADIRVEEVYQAVIAQKNLPLLKQQ